MTTHNGIHLPPGSLTAIELNSTKVKMWIVLDYDVQLTYNNVCVRPYTTLSAHEALVWLPTNGSN